MSWIPKVGDRVRATSPVGNDQKEDVIGTIRVYKDAESSICVEFDEYIGGHNGGEFKNGHCWWVYGEDLELVTEATPIPETPKAVEPTEPDYTNSCWYCRKGGLVDLYLHNVGTCPKCGRVMGVKGVKDVKVAKTATPAPTPDENRPLTTEELKALPDGTKVYIVWVHDPERGDRGEIRWDMSGWGRVEDNTVRWNRSEWQWLRDNGRCFDAYLTEQHKP